MNANLKKLDGKTDLFTPKYVTGNGNLFPVSK